VTTGAGATLGYDALLVAVGGIQRVPYPRALAFGFAGTEDRMHGLIQDVEDGYVKRLAFVVPPGASWPLPLYELALMTAERAFDMCVEVEITLVTPEVSPLAMFGPAVSRQVHELLQDAGIAIAGHADADRVITLPVLDGPAIPGLPHDAGGFLPTDRHGRVAGVPGVYAAGDATDFAIKQGGIACQQADAAAEAIAARAGVGIDPAPFAPVLRGVLLTERDARWIRRDLSAADGTIAAVTPEDRTATKIVGRELSRHLEPVAAR
jgi:sulfide:quinone oxidoreductase